MKTFNITRKIISAFFNNDVEEYINRLTGLYDDKLLESQILRLEVNKLINEKHELLYEIAHLKYLGELNEKTII